MEPLAQKILVVGGNGFIGECYSESPPGVFYPTIILSPGSAVCKAALARGIQVSSIRYAPNTRSTRDCLQSEP